jgi:methionine synthase II (cobalamin-independent)
MKITKDISIEELVDNVPQAVKYLMNEGIKCIACGEPIWGTLEDAAKEKGFGEEDIEKFVKDLQDFANNPSKEVKDPNSAIKVKKIDNNKNEPE